MSVASSAAYYDFQGLSSLRAQAIQAPSAAVEEVAGQFEALFVQMMLKSMREATIEGGLFDSDQMEVYQSMLDQQLSLHLSSQGMLGLSDILVDQLGEKNADPEEPGEPTNSLSLGNLVADARRHVHTAYTAQPATTRVAELPNTEPAARIAQDNSAHWSPSSPEEFIRGVWDHAVDAAGKLGLDPRVLVAQSALETGWGKRVIRALDGSSSFNLFGIKSGGDWEGDQATVSTLEFHDGVAAREHASFRVYDSIASSFNDYVDLLQSSPRYQQALAKVADSGDFLHSLQDAGYATDPGYAQKILNIMGTTAIGAAIKELKKF